MPPILLLLANSLLLGIGLAMDAFSVSLANGLHEPCMKKRRMVLIAGTFAFFQALMPLLGWLLVHTLLSYFHQLELMIPWLALGLLAFLGIRMILESLKKNENGEDCRPLSLPLLLLQGIATSIDALSVGLTISDSSPWEAALSALVIGGITLGICLLGLQLGRLFGTKFAGKAGILGGCILILIGLEIFITGLLGL